MSTITAKKTVTVGMTTLSAGAIGRAMLGAISPPQTFETEVAMALGLRAVALGIATTADRTLGLTGWPPEGGFAVITRSRRHPAVVVEAAARTMPLTHLAPHVADTSLGAVAFAGVRVASPTTVWRTGPLAAGAP